MLRPIVLLGLLTGSVAAFAQTVTVSAPQPNDFLGSSNTLSFAARNAPLQQHRFRVRVVNIANPLINFEFRKTVNQPNQENNINDTVSLNFARSTPEGQYRIEFIVDSPNVYNPGNATTPVIISPVTIDVVEPKFLDVNPINGAFVRGIVPVSLGLDEAFIKEWRVQVNGQDIPNNTGNSSSVNVNWDTAGIEQDGPQTLNIRVEDEASNTANRSISVTLDRVAPTINVLTPGGSSFRPGSNIPVSIDFVDQFGGSITPQSVDVLARRMDNTLLGRVARTSTRNNGATMNWTGRIRRSRNFPNQFKLVITAVDRAGNPATTQEVVVNLR